MSKFNNDAYVTFTLDNELFFMDITFRNLNLSPEKKFIIDCKSDEYLQIINNLKNIYTIFGVHTHYDISASSEDLKNVAKILLEASKASNLDKNTYYKNVIGKLMPKADDNDKN